MNALQKPFKMLKNFSMKTPEPRKKYNEIYERLVDDNEKDIVGLLAYCFYKQSKLAYIKAYTEEHKTPPSEQDIKNHVNFSEVPALPDYKKKAERTLVELLDHAVEEKQVELELDFDRRFRTLLQRYAPEGRVERFLAASKDCLFNGLGGLVGNILTTLVVIVFLFLIASSTNRDSFLDGAKRNLVSGFAQTLGVPLGAVQPNQGQNASVGLPILKAGSQTK